MKVEGHEWVKLPNIDGHCFGCGPENNSGLKMKFETDGACLRSVVTIPQHLRGWHHIVHGGVISTIADEIMAWAAIHLLKRFILTRSITTRFLKPVFINSRLTAYGRIKEHIDDRNALMTCRILNDEQVAVADAEGEFALFTAEQFKTFNLIPDEFLDNMQRVIF